jgi:hypothetical protein
MVSMKIETRSSCAIHADTEIFCLVTNLFWLFHRCDAARSGEWNLRLRSPLFDRCDKLRSFGSILIMVPKFKMNQNPVKLWMFDHLTFFHNSHHDQTTFARLSMVEGLQDTEEWSSQAGWCFLFDLSQLLTASSWSTCTEWCRSSQNC